MVDTKQKEKIVVYSSGSSNVFNNKLLTIYYKCLAGKGVEYYNGNKRNCLCCVFDIYVKNFIVAVFRNYWKQLDKKKGLKDKDERYIVYNNSLL